MAHQPSIFFLPGLDRMVAGMLNEEEEKSNQSMIEVGTHCFFHSFFTLLCLMELCERRQNKADERRIEVKSSAFFDRMLSIEVHVQYKSLRFTSTFVFTTIFLLVSVFFISFFLIFTPTVDVDLSGYEHKITTELTMP